MSVARDTTKLRPNFAKWEFECKCGCGGADVSERLLDGLQELRNNVGRAVNITSAYRCPEHNARTGGAENSQHAKGRAADIWISGYSTLDTLNAVSQVMWFAQGGIGVYPTRGHIHVDVRGYPARWGERVNGRWTTITEALNRLRSG